MEYRDRIFILDDDEERLHTLKKRYEKYTVIATQSYLEAEKIVQEEPRFTLMLLDHDLGILYHENTRDGKELTGYDFAKFIVSLPVEKYPEHIIVHSWNHPGARNMLQVLRQAKIPSTYERFKVNKDRF